MAEHETSKPKLSLGQTYITTNAMRRLKSAAVEKALDEHAAGNWEEFGEDRAQKDESAPRNVRLISVCHDEDGTEFWVITDPDLSKTTVLMPEDYQSGSD